MNLLVDLIDDTYLAAGPEKSIRALLQTLLRRRKGWEIGGIVSNPFSDLTQAAIHYGRIEQALRVLRKMNRLNRFVEYSQVNLFAKLFEAGDASRIARYLEQILSPIEERDPRQKTQLKKTLVMLHRQSAQYRADRRTSRRSCQHGAPTTRHASRNHRRLGRPDMPRWNCTWPCASIQSSRRHDKPAAACRADRDDDPVAVAALRAE